MTSADDSHGPGPPPIDPVEFAAIVRDLDDSTLARRMDENRDLILDEVFRNMEARLRPERIHGLDVAIDWLIGDRPSGGQDRFQVVIRAGECGVARDGSLEPDVTFTVGAVDFLRLVTGNATGPQLFIFGRLRVRGDLLLAARVPGFFSIPKAPARPGD